MMILPAELPDEVASSLNDLLRRRDLMDAALRCHHGLRSAAAITCLGFIALSLGASIVGSIVDDPTEIDPTPEP